MKNTPMLILLALLMVLVASAGVFIYYPTVVNIIPTDPKVIFEAGTNANNPDITSNIVVSLGRNKTSATVIVHPSYQTTYYPDILWINNTDSKPYDIYLRSVQISNTLPAGSNVILYIYSKGATRSMNGWDQPAPSGYLASFNLTAAASGDTISLGSVNGGDRLEIDILVYIPEGTNINGASATFNIYLISTPETGESPP